MKVLLVEDNEADRLIVRKAFATVEAASSIESVEDGIEAMKYLRNLPPYESAAKPSLILLDLNLPGKNGREVLAEIKSDPELKKIPVAILSSSTARSDICESYSHNASCYLVKPYSFTEFIDLAKAIHQFWNSKVRYCGCDPNANLFP